MAPRTTVVLGGGLAGMAAAYTLARAGQAVTIVERGRELGGLAGTFHRDGHFYPLAYHHILHRDRTLLFFLALIGALDRVRWRRIRMLFQLDGRAYDLGHPRDFLRFPMALGDKLRFAALMLRCFGKSDWSDWRDRSAAELVDRWAGPGVREALFERLSRLKFQLPCAEVSGAWLGARLYFREGSAPLGYIPGVNWTKVLCDGVGALLADCGVETRLGTSVERIETEGDRARAAILSDGERIEADRFVSTVPTEIYHELVPHDDTPEIGRIRYTAIVSAVCATPQSISPDFYWMNLAGLDCTACGIFRLESLNPSIGGPDEACVNFVTHVRHRDEEFFGRSDELLLAGYRADFRRVFGFDLAPSWTRLMRLPTYSPVFHRGYRNPPVRSTRLRNVWFAGNYRTFPSIASTGTALQSGVEAARDLLREDDAKTELASAIEAFRLRGMPRVIRHRS